MQCGFQDGFLRSQGKYTTVILNAVSTVVVYTELLPRALNVRYLNKTDCFFDAICFGRSTLVGRSLFFTPFKFEVTM